MGRGGASNKGFADHVNLYSKLDLRPHNEYDESIEAVEGLANGEFEVVEDVEGMHPRVFHEAFREPYQMGVSPAKVDRESLMQMREVLQQNSARDPFWINQKLFNRGYSQGIVGPENVGDMFNNPAENFDDDYLPEVNTLVPDNPYKAGRRKRKGDIHYMLGAEMIGHEISDWDIEIQ